MTPKSKIVDFYVGKGISLPRIKQLKPRGITDQDMESAAVLIYQEIKNGIQVDDNDLLRIIRRRALYTTSTKAYRREILEELIDNYREEFKSTKNLKIYTGSLSVLTVVYVIARILSELNIIPWAVF